MRAATAFVVILTSVLGTFATAAAAAADSDPATPPADHAKFHIFILMGQSNMAGSAVPILPDDVEPAPRVLVLGNDQQWHHAATPLDKTRGGGSSPGQSFARHYAELHPGVTVGLIQGARGGRGIKELAKGGKDRDGAPNYDNNLVRIKAAAQVGTLTAVLWHQGETDAGDTGYVERLATLASDLRGDLGQPQLPFICGELGRYATWTTGFNSRIPTAATAIPRCAVASSEGLKDLGDKVHFSGFSAEVLGARYLMQYLVLAEPAQVATFQPELDKLTAAMLAREAAWTVLLDGDMGEGRARPFAWDNVWTGKGTLSIVRDTAVAASAPSSMRLDSNGAAVQGSVAQTLRGVAGKTATITAKVRNAGLSTVQLALFGVDGSWKQVYQQTVIDASAATGAWTDFTGTAAVPANAANTRLAIIVNGTGSAWVDDVTVTLSETPAAAAPAAGTDLIANGAMADGTTQPTGWTNVWTGAGKLAVVRDTSEFKSGPASLRLDSVGGPTKGAVSQELKDVGGKQVRIRGWVKSDGKHGTNLGVVAMDGGWKMLKWQAAYQSSAGADTAWTAIDSTLEIPAGAEHVNLAPGIDGDGSAWFDDLSVTVVGK